jgi:hypothetical protein
VGLDLQQKLTNQDREDICLAYQQGTGVPTLAKQYQVSNTTIYQMLYKRNIAVRSLIPFTTGSPYRWPKTRPRTHFGCALEKILWRYGTNVRDFAPRIDLGFQRLYLKVTGEVGITVHFIYRIADELGLDDKELEELLEAAALDGYPKGENRPHKYEMTNFGKALKQMLWEKGITKQELKILLGGVYVSLRGAVPSDGIIEKASYALELAEEEREKLYRAKEKDLLYG